MNGSNTPVLVTIIIAIISALGGILVGYGGIVTARTKKWRDQHDITAAREREAREQQKIVIDEYLSLVKTLSDRVRDEQHDRAMEGQIFRERIRALELRVTELEEEVVMTKNSYEKRIRDLEKENGDLKVELYNQSKRINHLGDG